MQDLILLVKVVSDYFPINVVNKSTLKSCFDQLQLHREVFAAITQ